MSAEHPIRFLPPELEGLVVPPEDAQPEDELASPPRHLLLLGTPRSGSTLLASMIGRHPEVAMLNEDFGWAISSLVSKRIAANKLCVPNQISERRPSRSLGARLARRLGRLEARSAYSIADYLALPGIRVIAIARDPESVVKSIMRRGKRTSLEARDRWSRGTEILSEVVRHAGPLALVVTYDNLVTDPEREMKRVSRLLEIDYTAEMLEGYKFNPFYPGEAGIDSSRASGVEGSPPEWSEGFPRAVRCYQELVRMGSDD